MGWFNKNEESKEKLPTLPDLPQLPELPKLESAPLASLKLEREPLELPSFPTTSLGNKFSQNAIKEAVSGGKEKGFDVDDFATEDDMQMMHEPPRRPMTRELPVLKNRNLIEPMRPIVEMKREPVFVRIDKFEEGLKVIKKAKENISEIDKMISDIKRVKEEEEKELGIWERELERIKIEITKIDEDLFSQVE